MMYEKRPAMILLLITCIIGGSIVAVSYFMKPITKVNSVYSQGWEEEELKYAATSIPINWRSDADVLAFLALPEVGTLNTTELSYNPMFHSDYNRIFGNGSSQNPFVFRYINFMYSNVEIVLANLSFYFIFDHVTLSDYDIDGCAVIINNCTEFILQHSFTNRAFNVTDCSKFIIYNVNYIINLVNEFFWNNETVITNVTTFYLEKSDVIISNFHEGLVFNAFVCTNVSDINIISNEIIGIVTKNLFLIQNCSKTTIYNNDIQITTDDTGGISDIVHIINSTDIYVEKNYFRERFCDLPFISMHLENVTQYKIFNNTFYGFLFSESCNIIILNSTANGMLLNNSFDYWQSSSICINVFNYAENLTISNNTYVDVLCAVYMREIDPDNQYEKVGFISITIAFEKIYERDGYRPIIAYNLTGYNITVDNIYAESDNGIIIKNGLKNTISNSVFVGDSKSGNGIVLENANDYNSVINNTVQDMNRGMIINGFHYGSIRDNIITDTEYGMCLNHITYSEITGNVISDSINDTAFIENMEYSNFNHNILFNAEKYGINCFNNVNENIFYNNTIYDNGREGAILFPTTEHNLFYYNIFVNNYGIAFQAKDNGLNNIWDNGTHGNYWDDFKLRYPLILFTGIFWNGIYNINGSAFATDNHPLVYNYAFKMSFPSDIIAIYTTSQPNYIISWNIVRKTMDIDLDWKLEVYRGELAVEVCDSGTFNTDPRFAGLEEFDMEFVLKNYIASAGIIPINNYTFVLTIEHTETGLLINDTILFSMQNSPILIEKKHNLLFSADDGSQSIWFKLTDINVASSARYTIYRDASIVEQDKIWVSDQTVTVSLGFLANGEYNYKIIATDGYGATSEAFIHVSVSPEVNNKSPIIERITPFSYQYGSINNLVSITIIDNKTWYPEYDVYIDDAFWNRGIWVSTQSFSINIDGIGEGDHILKITAYDGYGMSSVEETSFNVFVGFNPPPIIQNDDDIYFLIKKSLSSEQYIQFSWSVIDPVVFLPSYTLYLNGNSVNIGVWYSGVPIRYDLLDSELRIGENNLTIVVIDGYGKSDAMSVTIDCALSSGNVILIIIISIIGAIVGLYGILYLFYKKKCSVTKDYSTLCKFF